MTINPSKIKDVIGSGGKTINKIIDETGVKIDIKEDGAVFVTAEDYESGRKALEMIEGYSKEVKEVKFT